MLLKKKKILNKPRQLCPEHKHQKAPYLLVVHIIAFHNNIKNYINIKTVLLIFKSQIYKIKKNVNY